mgnify:CR=1 FL=1
MVTSRVAGYHEVPLDDAEFDELTLVPFERRLLESGLLTEHETAWLDDYHRRVREALMPLLDATDRQWLERATRPLGSA